MCPAAIALDCADDRAFPLPQRFNWTAAGHSGTGWKASLETLSMYKGPEAGKTAQPKRWQVTRVGEHQAREDCRPGKGVGV